MSSHCTPSSPSSKVPRRDLGNLYGNKKLPNSVPIVGVGCSSFSNFFFSVKEQESEKERAWTPETVDRKHPRVQEWIASVLHAVLKCGINLLDTAPWYGCSETVVGFAVLELMTQNGFSRDDLIINTKVGRDYSDPKQFDFSYDKTLQSVQRSLLRLNCDYVNVLQLHDPEYAPSMDQLFSETIPAMVECQNKGWCRAIGMTGYPLDVQYQILRRSLDEQICWDQSLVYSHFNLHDSSLFNQPMPKFNEKSFADFCGCSSFALVAAAPLSMGLLTHAGPPEWHPASAELRQACREAANICESRGVNISVLATVMALSNPKISSTIIGLKSVDEVESAAAAARRFDGMDTTLSEVEILKLVLTEKEFGVWQLLQDPSKSPFALVWNNGKYKWDGVV